MKILVLLTGLEIYRALFLQLELRKNGLIMRFLG